MNVKDIKNLKQISAFEGNFAVYVTTANKAGIINRQGEVIYPADKYDGAFHIENGVFNLQVYDGQTPDIYFDAQSCKEVEKPTTPALDDRSLPCFAQEGEYWCAENRIAFKEGKSFGIKDENGNIIVPAQYTYVSQAKPFHFKNTLICVKDQAGLQGYIDLDGKTIIPCQYPYVGWNRQLNIHKFHTDENKWGYMDAKGGIIIPAEYDAIDAGSSYGLNEIAVSKDGRCYFINEKQEEVTIF